MFRYVVVRLVSFCSDWLSFVLIQFSLCHCVLFCLVLVWFCVNFLLAGFVLVCLMVRLFA